jgi:WD40 repeat protein
MFQQHEGAIQSVSFTPDSHFLLTTCTLGVMKVWHASDRSDTSHGDAVACLISVDDAHDLGVVSSDFSPLQELHGMLVAAHELYSLHQNSILYMKLTTI